jgi:hypothetical protein
MNETMRDYLKQRQRWYLVAFVIGLALLFLPAVVAGAIDPHQFREHRQLYTLVRLAGLLVLLSASLLRSRVKCPKCSKPLGAQGRWSGVPAFCPNCGVNFDEPMPQNPISPIS